MLNIDTQRTTPDLFAHHKDMSGTGSDGDSAVDLPLFKEKESDESSFQEDGGSESDFSFDSKPAKKPRKTSPKKAAKNTTPRTVAKAHKSSAKKPPVKTTLKSVVKPSTVDTTPRAGAKPQSGDEAEGSLLTPTKSETPRKKRQTPKKTQLDDRKYDIVFPKTTETLLLIQLDDTTGSLVGATGAVGRIEATADRVVLDLQGQQYIGTLLPGPTALMLGKHSSDENTLKVEGITNDFLYTEAIESVDINPLDFLHQEDNVNRKQPDDSKTSETRPKKQTKKR